MESESPEIEKKPNFTIRDTSAPDVWAVQRIRSEAWLDTYPNEAAGISRESIAAITDKWFDFDVLEKQASRLSRIASDPNSISKIAEDGDKPLGLALAERSAMGHQKLDALYVLKEYHGTGIAQELMTQALDWFDLSKPISLEVVAYNDRAIAFYKKYGFEVQEGEDVAFVASVPGIKMVRPGGLK